MFRFFAFFILLVVTAELASAQERLITVSGTGNALVQPQTVVMKFQVTGSGETTLAAHESFRKRRQLLEDKINPMDFPKATTEFRCLAISVGNGQMEAMAFPADMPMPDEMGNMNIRGEMLVRLDLGTAGLDESNWETALKLVDLAIASKATPGNQVNIYMSAMGSDSSFVQLESAEVGKGSTEARKKAFDSARQTAAELAETGGVQLGGLHSIREITTATEDDPVSLQQMAFSAMMGTAANGGSSLADDQIKVSVTLEVAFEVLPAAGK